MEIEGRGGGGLGLGLWDRGGGRASRRTKVGIEGGRKVACWREEAVLWMD